ncbi:MAG: CTP synthase, partial [Candidatus Aenigmatarchaeota archaeon]
DFILARAEKPLDKKRREKLSIFCNIPIENIISAPDTDSVYEVPLNFEKEELGNKILQKFNLNSRRDDLRDWEQLVKKIKSIKKQVKIAVVGKYFATGDFVLSDSYISVIEAVKHASWANNVNPNLTWVDSKKIEDNPNQVKILNNYDGIIVPGGFGSRGVEGIIEAIKYARVNQIPFLGLCYGMQLAVIEFARNVASFKDANSTEINPKTKYPVIDLMEEQKEKLKEKKYGGTMRLGAYKCRLQQKTHAYKAYNNSLIFERHRHRYEFNNKYKNDLENKGMVFSGINPEMDLVEIIELKKSNHPFFVATQFHPEFKSRPLKPHPLFRDFIKSAIKK